ncbi:MULTISPECIES: dihydrodipicolinate synthase family protein [unclassified Rhizobium]|uniref:dihydrodipicolinate synthase family protein n=1 Tax=unclassified Rhizobium TaxID=2613769 RepID=UPI000DDD847F|nr:MULTISPECIES: dihydrodipicolinate synthase family protein [unclassified Rhizobium]MBB3288492.1 4-hydroxy-tetrahydrodipicolinate synthase [Rhizobium sp. BK252]MBB3403371.1 4-hydroxy-tetrahydrodipicolinate synthase [Rhizobium sp. BK289]MBB3415946.1 4-hydroxy-tetrahydrodipicolinate synthase [Rhizobium sp. BK284]MBB3483834.1 4-hydroxy-tetrahydrodipicolinate synthase [Rhizobium sp. BK347]MDK4722188.1 dihydrodipicolinate synthase family protein [Rhizobium sp. CNPSo 3968]
MTLFTGLSAFPITPADASGHVDIAVLTRLLERIHLAGADSIGLLGSTGGYAFLSRDERRRAVEAAMTGVGGKIPVIVGVGALRTDEAQALARDARAAGADGLLLAPMSYTPLTEEEVYQHFAAVAEAGELPLCIYNNPGTTRFTFSHALIARLAKVANIVAVKMPLPPESDFKGEMGLLRQETPKDFSIGYSGDWGAAAGLLAGCDAWYSVIAGLLPAEALALTRAAQAGDTAETERLDQKFQPLWSLFKEFGSFRVMYAIAEALDLCRIDPPRPILPLSVTERPRVRSALDHILR